MTPAFIFILLIVPFITNKLMSNGMTFYCCLKQRKINFQRTIVAVILLLVGNILSVLFKLLHCQSVGDKKYYLYFAYEQCFGRTWIISWLF